MLLLSERYISEGEQNLKVGRSRTFTVMADRLQAISIKPIQSLSHQ